MKIKGFFDKPIGPIFGDYYNDLKNNRSTYEIIVVPGIYHLHKTPVKVLFTNMDYKNIKELNFNQMEIGFS